jgi:hypothetical protein
LSLRILENSLVDFGQKIIQEIFGSTFDQPSGAGWGLAGKLILRIHIPPYYSPSLG